MIWYRHPTSIKLITGPHGTYHGNGTRNGATSRTQSPSIEIVDKPKLRLFSSKRTSASYAPGTVSKYSRREGMYSSQLYAWRRGLECGDIEAERCLSAASAQS